MPRLLAATLLLFLALSVGPATRAHAQSGAPDGPGAAAPRKVASAPLKDPALATVLSVVITGGGQFYVGKSGKGALLLLTGVAAPLAGYALSTPSETYTARGVNYCAPEPCPSPDPPPTTRTTEANYAPLYIGIGVSAASWLWGVATASGDAKERNARLRKRSLRLAGQRVDVNPAVSNVAGEAGYGVKLTVQF